VDGQVDGQRDPDAKRAPSKGRPTGAAMERVTRIELAFSAWEADVLPLNYTREGQARYQKLAAVGLVGTVPGRQLKTLARPQTITTNPSAA
jgi:hypothetical protein